MPMTESIETINTQEIIMRTSKEIIALWAKRQFRHQLAESAEDVGVTFSDEDKRVPVHPTNAVVIFDDWWSSRGHYSFDDEHYSPTVGDVLFIDEDGSYSFVVIEDDEFYDDYELSDFDDESDDDNY